MRLPREFNENIKPLTVNRVGLISTSAWLHDRTKISLLIVKTSAWKNDHLSESQERLVV